MIHGAPTARPAATGLLERLQFAADLHDACHLLLEFVLQSRETGRAVVAVRADEAFRGAGYGVRDEVLRALFSADGASANRLSDLVDQGRIRVLQHDELKLALPICTLLPFPGPKGIPTGAVLLEGTHDGASDLAAMLEVSGPTLARIAETEALQDRLSRVERHSSLLDTVVDSLADPVLLTDYENNFLFANRRAAQLFSAKSEDSEGRRRAIRINDLLFSSVLTQAVIGGGQPTGRELNLVDPSDGSDLLFEVLTIPVSGRGGGVDREGSVISVLRDITDLKRALTELEVQFNRSRVAETSARQESDRLNVIIDNAGDPILVTDGESRIILVNGEAERLFDAAPMDGRAPDVRAVRANDTKFTMLMADFLLQPKQRRVENVALTDPYTGDDLPVAVVSSKIQDWRGEVSAIVSVLHDLTPLVENQRLTRELQVLNEGLEERIRLATEELEEHNRRLEFQSRELQKASRLKSEFLASMSHELRTPINAMLGYTALLREEIYGALNAKQEQALRKIYGASQHLLALINDILDLSKIEAGKMPIRVEPVRLDAVVSEISQAIEPMIREKHLDYRILLMEDLPVLRIDRTKLKQVLLNLLSNAVKFTQEGSVVLRAARVANEGRIRVEVEDTGIGIREEDREAIFDDFRQADQSHTRKYGGTGLGLSITRKLVTLMDGSVGVSSEVGRGSTFTVELPVTLEVEEDGV